MHRRTFLQSLAASLSPLALPHASSAAGASGYEHAGAHHIARITSITLTPIEGRFHKFVAMNSYDTAPKGHTYSNTLVRIATDQGVEGVGVMEYAAPNDAFVEALRPLIGASPHALYVMQNGRITGRAPAFEAVLARYPHLDSGLFDLIGKLDGKPCWQLLGESVRDRIELYDGTLYFSDVWFQDRGIRAVVEECEEAARKGYPAVKLKTGRGWRWMEKAAGLTRDIEVTSAVRRALGPEIKIMVDANNGYQRDGTDAYTYLVKTQADNVYFLEEPYPEDVARYTELRARIEKDGIKTLIADGENMTRVDQFRPYLNPHRLMDVLQMDIRRGGFLTSLELARLGATVGAVSVPHNWGAQLGLFMGLHFAKVVPNVIAAEDDRSTCDVIVADGYEFRQGSYIVSERPGLGVHVDEAVYARKYQARAQVITA